MTTQKEKLQFPYSHAYIKGLLRDWNTFKKKKTSLKDQIYEQQHYVKQCSKKEQHWHTTPLTYKKCITHIDVALPSSHIRSRLYILVSSICSVITQEVSYIYISCIVQPTVRGVSQQKLQSFPVNQCQVKIQGEDTIYERQTEESKLLHIVNKLRAYRHARLIKQLYSSLVLVKATQVKHLLRIIELTSDHYNHDNNELRKPKQTLNSYYF